MENVNYSSKDADGKEYIISALLGEIDYAISENKNFTAPEQLKFKLPGESVRVEMNKIIEKLYNEKIILDHGVEVAKELANVLSGGDTNINKTLTEDDLYKLELDSFMKLIQTKKTDFFRFEKFIELRLFNLFLNIIFFLISLLSSIKPLTLHLSFINL